MPDPVSADLAFEARTFRLVNAGDNHEFGVYTGVEMEQNNRHAVGLITMLRLLSIGESYQAGGGAEHVTIITRVS